MPIFDFVEYCQSWPTYEIEAPTLEYALAKYHAGETGEMRSDNVEMNYLHQVLEHHSDKVLWEDKENNVQPPDPAGFADLHWTVEDAQTLFLLSDDEAEDFLGRNEKHLRDRLTELGWGVLQDLGDYDGLTRKPRDAD